MVHSVYASLSIHHHTLYMLVGHLQKVSKSVSSESDQFSTCLWLLHHGVNSGYCGHICQHLDRLHKACYLQHSSRYPEFYVHMTQTDRETNRVQCVMWHYQDNHVAMLGVNTGWLYTNSDWYLQLSVGDNNKTVWLVKVIQQLNSTINMSNKL